MFKKCTVSFLVLTFLLGFALYAGAQTKNFNSSKSNTSTIAVEEPVVDAGVTPASPLHAFDRFGEWVRLNVFTFNPVRKAEIRTEIAEERLAELKAVVDENAEDAIERAEDLLRTQTEEVERNVEELDADGEDISSLVEKFNDLSLRQQGVLENVFDRVPDEAKPAIERALEASRRGFEKTTDAIASQVEKGHITRERAEELVEKNFERFEAQVERRSERLAELEEEFGDIPPEIKARFEKKIEYFENRLIDVSAREDFRPIKKRVRDRIKISSDKVVELRQRHEIRSEESEEVLEDLDDDNFNAEDKAREVISDAKDAISELKAEISLLEEAGVGIHQNVRELLANAEKHFDAARNAFDSENYGRALGQAVASVRNVKAALKFLEFSTGEENNAKEAIREAEEEIDEFERGYMAIGTIVGNSAERVVGILDAAKRQLKMAKEALEGGNVRRAIAHAETAERMADKGEDVLDRLEEVVEKGVEFKEETEERKRDSKKKADSFKEDARKRTDEVRVKTEERDKEVDNEDNKEDFNLRERFDSLRENLIPSTGERSSDADSDARTETKSSTASRAVQTYNVSIINSGFSPAEIKIQKGDTVIWTNNSSRSAWPASAVHPTHRVFPEFDALRGIKSGDSYKFQFNKMGEWRYHDHLAPSHTGIVNVVE